MTKKSDRINVRLGEELARKLDYLAARTQQNASDVLRDSIAAYYRQIEESPARTADLLDEFVGCVDGPRDLSSKYKEELERSLSGKV
jgi:predicted DNA-binding protein